MIVLLGAIGHYHDRPGGSPRVTLDEARELARRGDQVWMLAPGEKPMSEFETREGINYLRYFPSYAEAWNPARASRHQDAAKAVLQRHLPKVDAIHGHVPLVTIAAMDFYGDSVPSSYTIHSPAKMEMAIEWRNSTLFRRLAAPAGLVMINRMEAECLRRSNAVNALSQFTIDCMRTVHGDSLARKVQLTPGWVDVNRYVPIEDRHKAKVELGWPTDVPVLFTLRRLVARMGLDHLLDACRILKNRGHKFHLVLGGEGALRAKLVERAKILDLDSTVTFLGRVPDSLVPLAYGACDAFVLPTAELECFGIIALEALSAGRPVLATPVGAIPEVLSSVEPSWLSRSAGAEDIAILVGQFLRGELKEHSPGQLHETVSRKYSYEPRIQDFVEATIQKAVAQ